MPRHETLDINPNIWTLLTDDLVDRIRIQNQSVFDVILQATLTVSPPETTDGGLRISPSSTFSDELNNSFLGVGEPPYFLWIRSDLPCRISMSHPNKPTFLDITIFTREELGGITIVSLANAWNLNLSRDANGSIVIGN